MRDEIKKILNEDVLVFAPEHTIVRHAHNNYYLMENHFHLEEHKNTACTGANCSYDLKNFRRGLYPILMARIPKKEPALALESLNEDISYFNQGPEDKLDDIVSKFVEHVNKTFTDIDVKFEKINVDISKFKMALAKRFPDDFKDKSIRYLDLISEKVAKAQKSWRSNSELRGDRIQKYWKDE